MNKEIIKIEINCISLQSKRTERYMKILPYYKNLCLIEKTAFEGNNKDNIIKLGKEMNIIFDKFASYNNRALFLKSVLLWEKHLKSDNDFIIIIEDDVVPSNNIIDQFHIVTSELPKEFDICVLMGVKFGKPKEFSKNLYSQTSFSCIGAYLLSKNGARKLIKIAKSNIISTHNSGAVLDYWICCNMHKLNFYKTKEDLFYLLNIPSSLATSRCKLIEKFIPNLDSFLRNNYIFTVMLNRFGINGKITISYYFFINIFLNFLLTRLFEFLLIIIILLISYLLDIIFYNYLLEEKVNKFVEIILSSMIIIWI